MPFRPTATLSVIAAATALVAYVALHWSGTGMIADSWAYWEGAISLATGHGYTYFSGNRIEAWPPLYSAYLAAWVLVAGPYGWVLTTATGVLVVLQAALWMRLVGTLADDAGLVVSRAAWILVAVFIGLFLAGHERYPFSQSVLYVVLPLFLDATWRIVRHDERLGPRTVALGLLLPLTHTTGLAFLGAAAALIALAGWRSPRRIVLGALVIGVPAAAWIATRLLLGQTGSHCIGIGVGRYGPLEYAIQLFSGPGRAFMPDRLGLPILGTAVLWLAALGFALAPARNAAPRFVVAFCLLVSVALYVLFNVAWIYVPIGGRFVIYLPLLLVPMVGLALAARAPRTGIVLLALLLVPQFYWLGIWTLDQQGSAQLFARQPTAFLPHDGYATRDHRSGPPLRQAGRLLVAPDPEAQTDGNCH